MAGENWARRIVERELNVHTVINDDGSAPSMYDLRIGPAHAPHVAIECFRSVDDAFIETWNVGPARGPLHLALKNNWIVEVSTKARIKKFKQHIEPILQALENRGIDNLLVDYRLQWQDFTLFGKLSSLDVTHAVCFEVPGTGRVELALPGIGGAVDERGGAVPGWISDLLRKPKYEDVLRKLERAGAPEKHAFVFVGFAGAPFEVEGYLARDINHAPAEPPDLPVPVTAAWIISEAAQKGVRWDGKTWRLFGS